MTRIDFYVLDADAEGNRYQLACRVAEKARRTGKRVVIHSSNESEAEHVDKLLWTLWESGFVPHGRIGRVDHAINPILVGDGSHEDDEHEVLINLDPEVPLFFSRFDRLVECIDHDPTTKTSGRRRFAFYREHGYPLNTHSVS